MASYVPSQEQVTSQLRIIIPALGTLATAFGISSTQAGSYEQIALASIGPISYIVCAIWGIIDNTRKAILAKAAKPVDANTPAAQIVLSVQEAAVAQKLPENVTTTADTKVISR